MTVVILITVLVLAFKLLIKKKKELDNLITAVAIKNEEASVYYYTWIQLADKKLLTKEILDVYLNQKKESETRKKMLE